MLVENETIVELKAVKALDDIHVAQCINYLKATGKRVSLLLNFGAPRIEVKGGRGSCRAEDSKPGVFPARSAQSAHDRSASMIPSYRCPSVCIGGSKSGAFDAWGRQTLKTQGDYSCTYAYRYGDKLHSVTSNFPNEGNVTYQYGADQKRRERTAGGTTTKYRWDLGWNMINRENSDGTLTMTYVMDEPLAEVAGILADLSGTNPATGAARYYLHDYLGSTRTLRASDKSSLGSYEYTPYGQVYAESGASIDSLGGVFTGKPWDPTAQLYYFPFRYYSPDLARWLTRDPLGMLDGPNVYDYVLANPIRFIDPFGLVGCDPWWKRAKEFVVKVVTTVFDWSMSKIGPLTGAAGIPIGNAVEIVTAAPDVAVMMHGESGINQTINVTYEVVYCDPTGPLTIDRPLRDTQRECERLLNCRSEQRRRCGWQPRDALNKY